MKKLILIFSFTFCFLAGYGQDTLACDTTVIIPKLVTMGDDGIEVPFMPRFTSLQPVQYKMIIYDRWGNRLFETTDPAKGWYDEKLSDGVYVWVLMYYYKPGGDRYECRGNVTVIR